MARRRTFMSGLFVLFGMLALLAPARAEETAVSPPPRRVTPHWVYWRDGDPRDVPGRGGGGLSLVGGNGYVEAAFRWMIERSGGGDFLILRCAGDAEMHPYLLGLGGMDSVETLLLLDREASSDPFVLDRLARADAIWLAGGDQSRYLRRWQDTPVEDALNAAAARGVPLGGTSAGLHVLGDFSFAAMHGTITSAEALAHPDDRRVTMARDFLRMPGLAGVLTDSHFSERDRMGRLAVFLERIVALGWMASPRGVGVDELTAVLVPTQGEARVVGNGSAWFLQRAEGGWDAVGVPAGGTFDMGSWSGSGRKCRVSVQEGVLERQETGSP